MCHSVNVEVRGQAQVLVHSFHLVEGTVSLTSHSAVYFRLLALRGLLFSRPLTIRALNHRHVPLLLVFLYFYYSILIFIAGFLVNSENWSIAGVTRTITCAM